MESLDNTRRFEQVWRTTRDRFYDSKMNGFDWRAVGDRYRNRAISAPTHHDFAVVVNQMLEELQASHLGYFTDEEFDFYLLQSVFNGDMKGLEVEHIGVMGTREQGRFVVRAVLDGSPAAGAGVRVSERLLSVEGQPFSTIGAFRGRAGQTVRMEVEGIDGARRTISLVPVKENPQQAFLTATKRSVRIIRQAGKKIGYIHLWTMTSDAFREALESALTRQLADTDGLVLDLRDGYGGRPFGFTDVLFRPDILWGSAMRGHPLRDEHTGYRKPMVLLINGGTRSAKEFFAYQVQKEGRGLLVGTKTAGAFLGAGGFRIGSDGYLEIPVLNLTLDGRRIEGKGIEPDIPVEPQDTYGSEDRQLVRAVEAVLTRLRVPVLVVAPH